MNLLTRIAVGTAAVLVASTLAATAALATVTKVATYGNFTVMEDAQSKTCAAGIGNDNGTFFVAHTGGTHETNIVYSSDAIGDISGQSFPVTFIIDDKEYDWNAKGGNNSITITSSDPKVPAALRDSEMFGLMVGETPVYAIKSSANFDAAVNAALTCAHKYK